MKNNFKDWCLKHHREDILACYHSSNEKPPEEIGFSSAKDIVFGCPSCGHIWRRKPNKIQRDGHVKPFCPYCGHRRPSSFYNVEKAYPELLAYYDSDRNMSPLSSYLPHSHAEVWWRCMNGHVWKKTITEQVRTIKKKKKDPLCPYCSHERISSAYHLAMVHPQIAMQWNYERNGTLTPYDVFPSSQRKVWWQCQFNPSHHWQERISNRTALHRTCPHCNRQFHISFPAIAFYYYLTKHHLTCECEKKEHRYRIDVCIYPNAVNVQKVALELDGIYHTNLASQKRDEQKDAYLRKKGYRVIRVKENPAAKGITRCDDVFYYPASYQNRYLDELIQKVVLFLYGKHIEVNHQNDYDLIEATLFHVKKMMTVAVLYPHLVKEWSPRNVDRPDMVTAGCNQKRLWICPTCHKEYVMSIANRTRMHCGCPYCARKRVTIETCLATTHPEMVWQWDEEKNGSLTPYDVFSGSDRKVYWKCQEGHSWQARIYTRTGKHPSHCPYCYQQKLVTKKKKDIS